MIGRETSKTIFAVSTFQPSSVGLTPQTLAMIIERHRKIHQPGALERHYARTNRTAVHWLAVALTLLVALQTATPAWAWGRLGHRVISRTRREATDPESQGRDRGVA